jgi:hypothetical protein
MISIIAIIILAESLMKENRGIQYLDISNMTLNPDLLQKFAFVVTQNRLLCHAKISQRVSICSSFNERNVRLLMFHDVLL